MFGLIRLFLLLLLGYLGYHFLKGLLGSDGSKKQEVRGNRKTTPFNSKDSDIDDVNFEDIED